MNLVSDGMFSFLLCATTGGVGVVWTIHEIMLLMRLRGADRRDPLVRDQRFGYAMGIVIGMLGVIGTLLFIVRG
jgi:hypothetical protein